MVGLACLIATFRGLSANCVSPPADLVSWWAAEGNANDRTDGNNGLLRGNLSFTAGKVGQAFSFNGTDADVRVPASASLNVGLAEGFTIETWINPADAFRLASPRGVEFRFCWGEFRGSGRRSRITLDQC